MRSADVVARLGGDEFGVLLQNCGAERRAAGREQRAARRSPDFQFVWGQQHVQPRRQHRRRRDQLELQAPRAGHERRRHRLLRGQGRRAQPRRQVYPARTRRRSRAQRGEIRLGGAGARRALVGQPPVPRGAADPAAGAGTAPSRRTTNCWCACATSTAAPCRPARSCRPSSATTSRCATTAG
ncbi:MAG: GGDEF domain-containing protein [Comamonadaceae bacterium]|nr:GGDEF domain-containing protein [Comamonadaceae bacterium]